MKISFILLSLLFGVIILTGTSCTTFAATTSTHGGESSTVALDVDERIVFRTPNKGFLMLELLEAGYDRTEHGHKEWANIQWTEMDADTITSGRERLSISYRTRVDLLVFRGTEKVGGSDKFQQAGIDISWSYRHPRSIYLYLKGYEDYTILNFEQWTGGNAD